MKSDRVLGQSFDPFGVVHGVAQIIDSRVRHSMAQRTDVRVQYEFVGSTTVAARTWNRARWLGLYTTMKARRHFSRGTCGPYEAWSASCILEVSLF